MRDHLGYRLELREEPDVSDAERAAVGELLFAAWQEEKALGRGWHNHEPLFRAFAWHGSDLAAARMTCLVENEAGLRLFGFGDMTVAAAHRGHGLARALTAWLVEEAVARGAELLLVSTYEMASVYLGLGFRLFAPSEFHLVCPDGRESRSDHLYARWLVEPLPELVYHSYF